MTSIVFPQHARRDDPNGHMVVQQMVEFLRDAVEEELGNILRGSATVLSGNTFIAVTLSSTMPSYSVVVTPTVDPAGRFWVSNKSSTGFRVNLSAAAPVGGIAFDWIVKGD